MAVYMIVEMTITEPGLYAQYAERVVPIIEGCGGRFLARGGQVTPLAGGWVPERMILIEFDSLTQLKRCLALREYRALAPLRERSALARSIVVEGLAPAE